MSVVRIPPIPRIVRNETVQVRRQGGDGFGEPVAVPRCRVDRSASLSPNDYQLTAGCEARVFIDATEYDGDLLEGDLVGFDGEWHAVEKVDRCDHPDGTPHHWEADVR